MPRRRRIKEIQRNAQRAAKRPDLRGFEVEPVGKMVQIEDTWAERERMIEAERMDAD